MEIVRNLQKCSDYKVVNTTFNDDLSVPSYVGIMFSIGARSNIDILTLELDVRLDETTDLSVEVYTYGGSFTLFVNTPDVWTLLANTTLVRVPNGKGAIIPVYQFQKVSVQQYETQSFYITMRGPWIDSHVNALIKTGEVAMTTDDFDIEAGSGLAEYKFPAQVDTNVFPQFAGIIHYDTPATACTNAQLNTTVEYQFLIDGSISSDLLSQINSFVDRALDDAMQGDEFQSYITSNQLTKSASPSSAGAPMLTECPEGWNDCNTILTSVPYLHDYTLDARQLLYSMYTISNKIASVVEEGLKLENFMYVGYVNSVSDYELTMKGVPTDETMDDVQTTYLSNTTKEFLSGSIDQAQVLVMSFYDQFLGERVRGFRGLSTGTSPLRVTGQLLGAQYAFLPSSHFADTVQSLFQSQEQLYVDLLTFEIMRPGPINMDTRYKFFENIESAEMTVHEFVPTKAPSQAPKPTPAPTTGKNDGHKTPEVDVGSVGNKTWIIVGAVVGGVAILIFCGYLFRHILRKMDDAHDKKILRAKRKQESKFYPESASDDAKETSRKSPLASTVIEESDDGDVYCFEQITKYLHQSSTKSSQRADEGKYTTDQGEYSYPGNEASEGPERMPESVKQKPDLTSTFCSEQEIRPMRPRSFSDDGIPMRVAPNIDDPSRPKERRPPSRPISSILEQNHRQQPEGNRRADGNRSLSGFMNERNTDRRIHASGAHTVSGVPSTGRPQSHKQKHDKFQSHPISDHHLQNQSGPARNSFSGRSLDVKLDHHNRGPPQKSHSFSQPSQRGPAPTQRHCDRSAPPPQSQSHHLNRSSSMQSSGSTSSQHNHDFRRNTSSQPFGNPNAEQRSAGTYHPNPGKSSHPYSRDQLDRHIERNGRNQHGGYADGTRSLSGHLDSQRPSMPHVPSGARSYQHIPGRQGGPQSRGSAPISRSRSFDDTPPQFRPPPHQYGGRNLEQGGRAPSQGNNNQQQQQRRPPPRSRSFDT